MNHRHAMAAVLLALLAAASTAGAAPHDVPVKKESEGQETADIRSALRALPDARVDGVHEDGVPYMVTGRLGSAEGNVRGLTAMDTHTRLASALPRITAIFRLSGADLRPERVTTDAQGVTHIRYSQTKNGLPVVGEQLVLHVDSGGSIIAANGTARDGEAVPATPRISAAAATQVAVRTTEGANGIAEGAPRLVYLRPSRDRKLQLAYEQTVVGEGVTLPIRDRVYVSAADGTVLERFSEIKTSMNRVIHSANNTTTLPGTYMRAEGWAPTGDSHVDINYDHLATTYNCFRNVFGRDSFDNAGASLVSTVHYDSASNNAYWTGSQLVFGDGDGSVSGPTGTDLDTTVHEVTHAVTDQESALTYSGESGALNESMSDILATVCESWTRGWSMDEEAFRMSEDIETPNIEGDALRYLGDPARDGHSLDYYPDYGWGTDVHYSSGISNLAFTLLSRGGTHPRGKTSITVTPIGVERAARIFYKANADLFTPNTTFEQAKTYTANAAAQLGYDSATVQAVNAAWQAVGVDVVYRYDFQWGTSNIGEGSNGTFLTGDLDGDRRDEIIQRFDNRGWLGFIVYRWNGSSLVKAWGTSNIGQGFNGTFLIADVDGDKRAEIIQAFDSNRQLGLLVYRWNGSGLVASWGTSNMGEGSAGTFLVGDVDADGRKELIQRFNNLGRLGLIVYRWDGSRFVKTWGTSNMGQGYDGGFLVADVNGDGREEILHTWDNGGRMGLFVYGWNGSAFVQSWGTGDMGQALIGTIRTGDVEGDGSKELIQMWNSPTNNAPGQHGIIVYRWTGSGFSTAWSERTSDKTSNYIFFWQLVDVDGDGRSEILKQWGNNGRLAMVLYRWDRQRYYQSWVSYDLGQGTTALTRLSADLDADGRTDLIHPWNNNGWLGMYVYRAAP